jgi:hypothetical protein
MAVLLAIYINVNCISLTKALAAIKARISWGLKWYILYSILKYTFFMGLWLYHVNLWLKHLKKSWQKSLWQKHVKC